MTHDLLRPAGVLWYVAALLCWRVVTPTWVEWNSRPIIAAVMLATVLYLASFFSPEDFRTGTAVHVVVRRLARVGVGFGSWFHGSGSNADPSLRLAVISHACVPELSHACGSRSPTHDESATPT